MGICRRARWSSFERNFSRPDASLHQTVLLRLSGGGVVHGYGLAASQLLRIKDAGVKLTISVDKVASGGYMMACVANKFCCPLCHPGSIGVVAQLPPHKPLKKNDIDFEMPPRRIQAHVTVFGENTDKAGRNSGGP